MHFPLDFRHKMQLALLVVCQNAPQMPTSLVGTSQVHELAIERLSLQKPVRKKNLLHASLVGFGPGTLQHPHAQEGDLHARLAEGLFVGADDLEARSEVDSFQ